LKKVCVIGASGLLGNKLTRLIADYDVFGTFNQAQTDCPDVQLMKLDITKYEECESILKIRPDFIVNTAAIANVDYCERFQEKSYLVNVRGTANLAKIANKLECKLIQISTNGIFSGEKGNYKEDDEPNPINYYGKTKLESESEVRNVNDHIILRTNLLYGYIAKNLLESRSEHVNSTNFVLWVLSELNKKKSLKIVNDQFSNPTLADNLAKVIIDCIKKDLVGTFHATDITCLNRFEFVKKIVKKFGFSEDLISEISSEEFDQLAKRPSKTCMDCSKIQKNGINLHSVDESLDTLFDEIKEKDPTIIPRS